MTKKKTITIMSYYFRTKIIFKIYAFLDTPNKIPTIFAVVFAFQIATRRYRSSITFSHTKTTGWNTVLYIKMYTTFT